MESNHDPITEATAPKAMAELRDLLNQPGLPPTEIGPSVWSPQEVSTARQVSIARHLKAGWTFDGTYLTKRGAQSQDVSKRPTTLQPLMEPGDQGWDPRVHAFALRLGAVYIEPPSKWAGKYLLDGEHVVDWLGRFVDMRTCPVCQGDPFNVLVSVRREPHFAQEFSYCPRCVTQAMVDENARRVNAAPPQRRRL